MTTIDYGEKIPNNVDLGADKTLQRALEQWQPNYLGWWNEMGPEARSASTSTCGRRSARSRRDGPTSIT